MSERCVVYLTMTLRNWILMKSVHKSDFHGGTYNRSVTTPSLEYNNTTCELNSQFLSWGPTDPRSYTIVRSCTKLQRVLTFVVVSRNINYFMNRPAYRFKPILHCLSVDNVQRIYKYKWNLKVKMIFRPNDAGKEITFATYQRQSF